MSQGAGSVWKVPLAVSLDTESCTTSVSPMRRWVPMGRLLRSMPRVLMFSAKTPASRGMGQAARFPFYTVF